MKLKELAIPLPVITLSSKNKTNASGGEEVAEEFAALDSNTAAMAASQGMHLTDQQLEIIRQAAAIPGVQISLNATKPISYGVDLSSNVLNYRPLSNSGIQNAVSQSTSSGSYSNFISTPPSPRSKASDPGPSLSAVPASLDVQSFTPDTCDIDQYYASIIPPDIDLSNSAHSQNSQSLLPHSLPSTCAFSGPNDSQLWPEGHQMSLPKVSLSTQRNGLATNQNFIEDFEMFLAAVSSETSSNLMTKLHTFDLDVDQAMPSTLRYGVEEPYRHSAPIDMRGTRFEAENGLSQPREQGCADSSAQQSFELGNSIPVSLNSLHAVSQSSHSSNQTMPAAQVIVTKVKQKKRGVRSTQTRRGPFQTERERMETAIVRKNKACVRCRLQKTRCVSNPTDPSGPCMPCTNIRTSIIRIPCLRYKITEALMNNRGAPVPAPPPDFVRTYRWDTLNACEIKDFESTEARWLELTQGCGPKMKIQVKRYTPREGETTALRWRNADNERVVLQCPPFAIESLDLAKKELLRCISDNLATYIESTLDDSNPIIWNTFAMMFNILHEEPENRLIKDVLVYFVACRLCNGSMRICGNETLGMEVHTDKSSPYCGYIPLPPVCNTQIQRILIHQIIIPLRNSILARYQSMVTAKLPSNWFTLYLCTFALVHNLERIIAANAHYAARYQFATKFANAPFVEEILSGATTILAHFHYCCKGQKPFSFDWEVDEVAMAELSIEQKRFMDVISKQVKEREARFRLLREKDRCGDDLSLSSQIFDPDWKPTRFLV